MLLRAEYVLGEKLERQDFVGETAEREFSQWLVGIARDEETFRYMGRTIIQNPIHWRYNEESKLEIWNGLLPIGEADMVVSNSIDIEWFFENYLKVPMGEIHVNDEDVCEKPPGWFDYSDVIFEPMEDEDEKLVDVRVIEIEEVATLEKPIAEKPMSKFEIWFRTFIEEKDLPVVNWEIEHNDNVHFIDNYDVVEIICEAPFHEQKKVKEILVKLDFHNGDINHFLEHLAKGYIETNY
jgi:hypothetical protein